MIDGKRHQLESKEGSLIAHIHNMADRKYGHKCRFCGSVIAANNYVHQFTPIYDKDKDELGYVLYLRTDTSNYGMIPCCHTCFSDGTLGVYRKVLKDMCSLECERRNIAPSFLTEQDINEVIELMDTAKITGEADFVEIGDYKYKKLNKDEYWWLKRKED